MQMKIKILALLIMATFLTACASKHKQSIENELTTNQTPMQVSEKNPPTESTSGVINTPSPVSAVTNQPIAGDFEQRMDTIDKSKLSKALDKALGKMTEWTNDMTGITYRVVPVKKVVVDGNQFCRKYMITVIKNEDSQELNGTACVTEDGNWHVVR